MSRTKRRQSTTGFYHVFIRGINKEKIFNQVREKIYFKRIIKENLEKSEVEIHAYCIMSNHAHLIIKSSEKENLSYFMSKVLAKYAEYYNYKHNRNGHVFQNRFGSECIESEKYYWNCIKYIHLNPVKALMVPNVLDYKFSSIGEYRRDKSGLLHKNAIQNYKSRFTNWNEYLEYHYVPNEIIFLGTKEEIEIQRKEQILNYLWLIQKQEELENVVEIFEDTILRERYLEMIKEKLKISKVEAKRLYIEIREKYIK